ncbi:MAG: hypothetical protein EG828_16245, partial [Deltaproteobacteria bacterium]|nr:hypothetical protein [Deltaproteobacteria bacterium]
MESRGILSRKDKIMTLSKRRSWTFSAFLFMLVILWGCAAPAPAPKPQTLYDAKLPPNIGTIEEARADLAALFKATNIFTMYGDVGLCQSISRDTFYSRYPHVSKYGLWENGTCFFYANSVEVSSDRIDFPPAPLLYEDLRGFKLTVRDGYLIDLPNRMNVAFRVEDSARIANRFADDLYFIQQNVNANHAEKMAAFREKAARYRSASVK